MACSVALPEGTVMQVFARIVAFVLTLLVGGIGTAQSAKAAPPAAAQAPALAASDPQGSLPVSLRHSCFWGFCGWVDVLLGVALCAYEQLMGHLQRPAATSRAVASRRRAAAPCHR